MNYPDPDPDPSDPDSITNYSCSQNCILKRHMQSVHEKKKPHKCSICDYSCSQKGDLKKHIESVHEEKKSHKCSICDYTCSRKGQLKIHIESVHERKKSLSHKCWTWKSLLHRFMKRRKITSASFVICILTRHMKFVQERKNLRSA